MLDFYHYPRCTTCIKARKYLISKGFQLRVIDITLNPPSTKVLISFIKKSGRSYTDFLNRSGAQYREQNMKEKLKKLPVPGVLSLLAANGRLIKRPIVVDEERVTVGFNEADFNRIWSR